MSFEEMEKSTSRLRGRMSIATRINLIIIFSTLLMTVVALIFSLMSFRESTIDSLSASATQIAYLASELIDPEQVDAYLETGTSMPEYLQTMERLRMIKNSSEDIAFLYVYKIEADGCHLIFDLDAVLNNLN